MSTPLLKTRFGRAFGRNNCLARCQRECGPKVARFALWLNLAADRRPGASIIPPPLAACYRGWIAER